MTTFVALQEIPIEEECIVPKGTRGDVQGGRVLFIREQLTILRLPWGAVPVYELKDPYFRKGENYTLVEEQ